MDKGKEFSRLVAIELSAEGKRRGITHVQIAAAAGISPGMISYYIAGTKGDMTVATLLRAAQRLGINPEVIVERAYAVLESTPATVTLMPERGAWEPQQTAAAHEYDDVPEGDGFEPDVPLGDDEYA